MMGIIGTYCLVASLSGVVANAPILSNEPIKEGYNSEIRIFGVGHNYEVNNYLRGNTILRLNEEYPNFEWRTSKIRKISDVANMNPINIMGDYFTSDEIETAINNTGIISSYGGCGPIALIGILDYFSRVLNYNEIINNPYNSADRISLAEDVFTTVQTFTLSEDSTTTFPWDLRDGFNDLMEDYGLSNNLYATSCTQLLPNHNSDYWDKIVGNINNGIPVTLMSGFTSEIGRPCDEHCSNVFGYEEFTGINVNTNETVIKKYLIVRVNWPGCDYEFYCDADILHQGLINLVEYHINYPHNYSAYAYDFAEEFVNSQGNGQYFYYDISEPVYTNTDKHFNTSRLRCSYIENQYLVLSPKREGAGSAYLSIETRHQISKLIFNASLWSVNEDHGNETFKIQTFDGTTWNDYIDINLFKLSKNKNNLDEITVLFPRNTRTFRFLATHSAPSGDKNKGRIVLDNIQFFY